AGFGHPFLAQNWLCQRCSIFAQTSNLPQRTKSGPNNMSFNVFDVALSVILVLGILRGRKQGMSQELMSLMKWLAIVIGCALVYEPVGSWLAQSSPFSLLASFMMVYITLALVILGVFALVKHRLGDKLVGSDIFGRSEYYLGMVSGLVRFSCILLAGLALL